MIYRVPSPDKHTIKIWWNSVHYWGSNHIFVFWQNALYRTNHTSKCAEYQSPIQALVMGNVMLKFHNDSCNFVQVGAPATSQRLEADLDSFSGSATYWREKIDQVKKCMIYRVSSPDQHTIKSLWNSVHYWGSNHSFCVFDKVPPIGQTIHRNAPNVNPIQALVMGNMMLKFHNDSSNFVQVRAPVTSRRRLRLPFSESATCRTEKLMKSKNHDTVYPHQIFDWNDIIIIY
jgi:hypothetical protein